jgi:hypothetical protein
MSGHYLQIFFYLLITVATAAQAVLKKTNDRFSRHGEERRRSVASIFPVIVAKTLLFVLAFPVICAVVLAHESWEGVLVSRSHLCAQYVLHAPFRPENFLTRVLAF